MPIFFSRVGYIRPFFLPVKTTDYAISYLSDITPNVLYVLPKINYTILNSSSKFYEELYELGDCMWVSSFHTLCFS